MDNSSQDERINHPKNNTRILLFTAFLFALVSTMIFVHPDIRYWISQEGDSLQVIDATIGIMIVIGEFIIHPIWIMIKRPDTSGTVSLTSKPRLIDQFHKYRRIIIRVFFSMRFLIPISLVGGFFIIIGQVMVMTPVFVITSPRDESTVTSEFLGITVKGKGARPGGSVKVYVFDGERPHEQRENVYIDQNGYWSVDNVVLQTEGYKYTIWAETIINGVTTSTTNRPRVIRNTPSFPIILTTIISLLIIVAIILLLTFRRQFQR